MSKKLKIVFVSAEVAPFSKTGGLGDVASSLPKALKKLGHDIILITPFYEQVIDKEKYNLELVFENIKIHLNSKDEETVSYWRGFLDTDLPVYFVEAKKYFSKKKNLYGSARENGRFLVFDVAALKLISLLKYEADIIHCHDWHTGLIPFYLKTDFCYSKTLSSAKTIYTIHNLAFQLGCNWWEVPLEKKDYGKRKIPHINDPDLEYINFAKRAILSADAINTVSEQYREEIMTKNFGQDLNRILKNRQDKLFGIINGIDYHTYNPENDPGLFKNYTYKEIKNKKLNKEYLKNKLGLSEKNNWPIIAMTSRLTFQKGFELFIKILDSLLKLDVQFIIMGDGDKKYISELKKYSKKYPQKLIWLPFSERDETMIYAGSDFFLLPSHYEPCGINQLIAMRYGCVPIVRKVGGLHDTVEDFDPENNQGTGFVFKQFHELSLFGAIIRALENYKYKKNFDKLVARAMRQSNNWEIPAKKYEVLYKYVLD
jgi:starch synthase